jgi:RNA polymerase sigma factor (sigma-70 family)
MRATIALLAAAAIVGAGTPAPATARAHTSGHSERLAARARRGDRVARTALVEQHMGLVRAVAFRYRNLGIPVEDLVQEGAIGLLTAIDEYDSERGGSFSTYAFWRIRSAVTHALTTRASMVRMPRTVLERRRRVRMARDELSATGHAPSVRELAALTSLSPAAVAEAMAPTGVASLDQPLPDGTLLGERLAGDEDAQPAALALAEHEKRAVHAALQRLRPRKQAILRRHYGIDAAPESLNKIASELHLSPERTRALKDEALRELAGELTAAGV